MGFTIESTGDCLADVQNLGPKSRGALNKLPFTAKVLLEASYTQTVTPRLQVTCDCRSTGSVHGLVEEQLLSTKKIVHKLDRV